MPDHANHLRRTRGTACLAALLLLLLLCPMALPAQQVESPSADSKLPVFPLLAWQAANPNAVSENSTAECSGVIPSERSLGNGMYKAAWCRNEARSPRGFVWFLHNQNGAVPENEWQFKAYYHPAIVLDNVSTGAGHRASLMFRSQGKPAWSITFDPRNDDSGNLDIRERDVDMSRLQFLKAPSALDLKEGTAVYNILSGNTRVDGFAQIRAGENDATARAAIGLRSQGGTESWLRLNGNNRVWEICSARNGGTCYGAFGASGLIVGDPAARDRAKELGRLTNTMTWDPPRLEDGQAASTTLAVAGAEPGDICKASHAQLGGVIALLDCHVESPGVVRVVLLNKDGGGIDVRAGTLRAVVEKY